MWEDAIKLWTHAPPTERKKDMTKSLTWLLDCMLDESGIRCSTDTHRDKITISRRIKHEGISFLTITLPRFGADFESCLRQGKVDSNSFLGFKKRGPLPVFLQGLVSQVFDPVSGELLTELSKEAILCVRQVCLAHKKVNLPCTEQRIRRAYDKFGEVENELTGLIDRIPEQDLLDFEKVSGILWSDILGKLSEKIESASLVPKHGPGATAEKISGNQKYNLRTWHTRLQEFFPFDMYGATAPDMVGQLDFWGQVEFVEPGMEPPVRVVAVPKTLKAPRIIAIEPVCMQYIQQAILEAIVPMIESGRYSRGHVNFTDQSINRSFALEASMHREFATMDLSDASDRVHKDLVDLMLCSAPYVGEAIFACRSTRATLPNGKTYHLEKFASMGSALCFPIESMVFFTLCTLSRLRTHNLPLTPRNVFLMSQGVYVYGDDLIVPTDEVLPIADTLETFGLKVNQSKTFGGGNFRESCGMDAYDGVDVTPVYVRSTTPSNRRCAPELVSFVSLANQLYSKGWWATAKRVRAVVESILGPLPTVTETSQALGWHTLTQGYSIQRWDPMLHVYKVKAWVAENTKFNDPLEGHGALLKFFLKRGSLPTFEKHLERSVRPGSTCIKSRWVTAY